MLNEKFVTAQQMLQNPTVNHFATRLQRSRVFRHVSLCWQHHPKCEQAIRLAYPPFFCKLLPSSNPTNKKSKGTGSRDKNSSVSVPI